MTNFSKKIVGEIQIPKEITEKNIENVPTLKKEIEKVINKEITEILNIILGGSIKLGASDIHIEPKENETKLRIRLDGILQDVIVFERKIYELLNSRIKLLSGMKLNVFDRPQDGRFSVSMEKSLIEVRTSTLPAEWGRINCNENFKPEIFNFFGRTWIKRRSF